MTQTVEDHHSKRTTVTEKLLRYWEQESKDRSKENWMVGKANQKPQNISNERNNEHKMKNRNPWKEQPERKLNEKEISNDPLKGQQDQCSTTLEQ